MLVQNRVASRSRGCEEVQRNGVVTRKNSPDILMVVFMLSPDDIRSAHISNYALLQVRDQLLRLDGIAISDVRRARLFDAAVARSRQIANLGLTSGRVVAAIRAKRSAAGGQIGSRRFPSRVSPN